MCRCGVPGASLWRISDETFEEMWVSAPEPPRLVGGWVGGGSDVVRTQVSSAYIGLSLFLLCSVGACTNADSTRHLHQSTVPPP